MRQTKSPLRGSVTQNNLSVRMRAREQSGLGFLARLGLLLVALLIIVALVGWLWHEGWIQTEVRKTRDAGISLTKDAQFFIKDIVVQGRQQSGKDEISDALNAKRGDALLGFDTKAAAERIGKLPWVKTATVERRLPDTLVVILTERIPTARWQHDDHFAVIDSEGHPLPSAKPENFTTLPLVVGTGADSAAQDFLAKLNAYPDIQEKTESSVRVGERRWDIHLHGNITVRLPEQGVSNALHRLSVLIAQEKILDRDIVAIDLRLSDRLIIEPRPTPPHP